MYEIVPKEICIPERNRRYDMLTEAKFACADDSSCSGLVEAPKRRNQNKKFGKHWTFTEREFFLCDYPVRTKPTDDTLFFRKRGMYNEISTKKFKTLFYWWPNSSLIMINFFGYRTNCSLRSPRNS